MMVNIWRSASCLLITCLMLRHAESSVLGQKKLSNYQKARQRIMATEKDQRTGSQLNLSPVEKRINEHLMSLKETELGGPGNSLPLSAQHFFQAQPAIAKSPVFKMIRDLPKGSCLHIHDSAIGDKEWLMNNLTYWDNLYFKLTQTWDTDGKQRMSFKFLPVDSAKIADDNWTNLKTFRSSLSKIDLDTFNQQIYENLTIYTDNPAKKFPSQSDVWDAFQARFGIVNGLTGYVPAFKAYLYRSLEDFYNDNVMYLELRSVLTLLAGDIYELDGSGHDVNWLVKTFKSVSDEFVKTHPGFLGMRLIHSTIRVFDTATVMKEINEGVRLVKEYPNFVLGFDLVGREDTGHPLKFYLDQLLQPSNLRYFFHAGETDHFGSIVDENLVDALLLNTSRIGHGYALAKHAELMKMTREKGVAIEVNPISNQVLGLVADLRDHPASVLYANDIPMVIASDDPMLWGAEALSYDFYAAFMGFSGKKSDLKFLKQLAINSIRYSALDEEAKLEAMLLWEKSWLEAMDQIHDSTFPGLKEPEPCCSFEQMLEMLFDIFGLE